MTAPSAKLCFASSRSSRSVVGTSRFPGRSAGPVGFDAPQVGPHLQPAPQQQACFAILLGRGVLQAPMAAGTHRQFPIMPHTTATATNARKTYGILYITNNYTRQTVTRRDSLKRRLCGSCSSSRSGKPVGLCRYEPQFAAEALANSALRSQLEMLGRRTPTLGALSCAAIAACPIRRPDSTRHKRKKPISKIRR